VIEAAVRAILLADATVAGLVGTRVYTGTMPQRATFPLITLKKVDKLSDLTLEDAVGPNRLRVQVDCWAQDVDGVRALAAAVNGSDDQSTQGPLHGYSGSSGGQRINLLRLLVERSTEYESETQLYRVSADYAAHL
jgi:Protein of unknown function (DUF3168)